MRLFVLFGVGLLGLFVVGCGSPPPKKVATQFYTALEKGDSKTVGTLVTAETADILASFGPKMTEAAKMYGKVKSATEEINGNTATVTLTFENGKTDNVDLVKIDGKWKVSMQSSSGGK